MANQKKKKLQLIQAIWNVILYSHFVLESRVQREWYWEQQICQMERNFDPTGQSGTPSELVLNILVGPNRNGPFHLMYQPKFPEFWVRWKAVLDSREITSLPEIKKVIYISTWHVILIIADHKPHAHHNTHFQTMKVYNTRPVSLLLIKILLFFFWPRKCSLVPK